MYRHTLTYFIIKEHELAHFINDLIFNATITSFVKAGLFHFSFFHPKLKCSQGPDMTHVLTFGSFNLIVVEAEGTPIVQK